ncbi:hypothetical protein LIER_34430 [Lithospermum erythrorhizon]|uniref:Helitron helicase-like domain-containing protein n=1 Tax=Lithospermum erythrorhizon TaxID=34254 RepID=A0AAV3S378_LITER
MRHKYLDSMILEIKECLKEGEEAQNRPDLLCRVFKAKLSILNDKIMSDELFGTIVSVVHVVEFQKRGLPHAHFLIILKQSAKYLSPKTYDRIVSEKFPDKISDPYLYGLVMKHMMDGPCGNINRNNLCIRDGKCKNYYPKEFSEYTTHGKGNYLVYRRRNDGRTAKAVKYLHKYIHEGHDKVMFRIGSDSDGSVVNEITDFQNARWVSPREVLWRIYGFPLFGMYPAIMQFQVHLSNFQSIQSEDDTDLE